MLPLAESRLVHFASHEGLQFSLHSLVGKRKGDNETSVIEKN